MGESLTIYLVNQEITALNVEMSVYTFFVWEKKQKYAILKSISQIW